jgi:hypothetical protein
MQNKIEFEKDKKEQEQRSRAVTIYVDGLLSKDADKKAYAIKKFKELKMSDTQIISLVESNIERRNMNEEQARISGNKVPHTDDQLRRAKTALEYR